MVVGDRLWVEVLDGELQRFEIPVAQLTREYMGVQAYMELDALNDRLGDGDVLSGASLTVDEDSRAAVARRSTSDRALPGRSCGWRPSTPCTRRSAR